MEALEPGITVKYSATDISVLQQRPAVTAVLKGQPVAQALSNIPTLLPLCGEAQAIAGARAIEASQAVDVTGEVVQKRREQLLREQAKSIAWRLTVDWPELLAEPRDLQVLRRVRNAEDDAAMGDALANCVPGLLEHDHSIDALMTWVQQSSCLPARVASEAGRLAAGAPKPLLQYLTPAEALEQGLRYLDQGSFDPLGLSAEACYLGPLAMSRHPLLPQLADGASSIALDTLYLAHLLDACALIAALCQETETETETEKEYAANSSADGNALPASIGTGWALTARGPVIHRVQLDDSGARVLDWRVLAPTDWHFAPRGPLWKLAQTGVLDKETLRFFIVGLDPCVSWDLHFDNGESSGA